MLVSGPSAQSVTDPAGSARSVSTMKSTAWASCSGMVGSGSVGPSSPVLPWTCSAVTSCRSSGRSQPEKTRDLGLAGQLADDARVLLRQIERHVAGDRRDAEHLDLLGRGEREEDRHGVVLSGIGVDDDLARGHGSLRKAARLGSHGEGGAARPRIVPAHARIAFPGDAAQRNEPRKDMHPARFLRRCRSRKPAEAAQPLFRRRHCHEADEG